MSWPLTALTRQENTSTFSVITAGALIVFTDLIWRIINAPVPQFFLLTPLPPPLFFLVDFFFFVFLVTAPWQSRKTTTTTKKTPTFQMALKGWFGQQAAGYLLSVFGLKHGLRIRHFIRRCVAMTVWPLMPEGWIMPKKQVYTNPRVVRSREVNILP